MTKHWQTCILMTVTIIMCSEAFTQESKQYNVLDFGANATRTTHSTMAIQAAIDRAYNQGGGTVYFPDGEYECGTIILKDHVTLNLSERATIHASRNIEDYRMPLEDAIRPVLIYANGATDIGISGKGTIIGHAEHTYEDLKKTDRYIPEITKNARAAGVEMKQFYIVRPDVGLVVFTKCTNIHLEEFTLTESSFWTLLLVRSDSIKIKGIHVFSSLEKGVNADGIDINSCSNVVVSDCIVKTGDDAIVLKTWYTKPCENIVVKNCTLASSSTALKIGTESHGDFRNILFKNCIIEDANRGLSIVVRYAGHVENVTFQNIDMSCSRRHFNWWGNADPIWVYLTDALKKPGSITNVTFKNITATAMGTSRVESTTGSGISNITFENIDITLVPENYADKRAEHGFYMEHIDGLNLINISLKWQADTPEANWKSALVMEDIDGLTIDGFSGQVGQPLLELPVIELKNTRNAVLKSLQMSSTASNPATGLIRITGSESEHIKIYTSDSGKDVFEITEDVTASKTIKQISK